MGEKLYQIESGIIASWAKMAGETKFLSMAPFRPQMVGLDPFSVVMGKNSGIDSVVVWLEELEEESTEEQRLEMVARIKAKALDKKDLLTLEEFKEIYKDVTRGLSRAHPAGLDIRTLSPGNGGEGFVYWSWLRKHIPEAEQKKRVAVICCFITAINPVSVPSFKMLRYLVVDEQFPPIPAGYLPDQPQPARLSKLFGRSESRP